MNAKEELDNSTNRGVAAAKPQKGSSRESPWELQDRAVMILISHIVFVAFSLVMIYQYFPANGGSRSTTVENFIGWEATTGLLCAFALIATPELVATTKDAAGRALPRMAPYLGEPKPDGFASGMLRTMRWVALWGGITAGFLAAGVLIMATDGLTMSAFVQLPFTMVILGALMSNNWWTAVGVFAYGVAYAWVLLYAPDSTREFLFGGSSLADARDENQVTFLVTVLNAAIGVSVTYLSRPPVNTAAQPSS